MSLRIAHRICIASTLASSLVTRSPAQTTIPPSISSTVSVGLSKVVFPDLSNSVGDMCLRVREAAAAEVTNLPEHSAIAVIGISERTFTRPIILLLDSIPGRDTAASSARRTPIEQNVASLGQQARVHDARARITQKWSSLSNDARFACNRPGTDIIGGLALAQYYLPNEGVRWLVYLGDGRHRTADLDLESPARINPQHLYEAQKRGRELRLSGLHVCFVAIPAPDRDLTYWGGLREFWETLFTAAGAIVEFTPTYPCTRRRL